MKYVKDKLLPETIALLKGLSGNKNTALLLPTKLDIHRRLIWLKLMGGSSSIWTTVSGTSPLSLDSAISGALRTLIQYGKVSQASTPTPTSPVDIVCNNGAVRYGVLGKNLFDPNALTSGKYVGGSGSSIGAEVNAAAWSCSDYIPVESGGTYTLTVPLYTKANIAGIAFYSTADVSGVVSGLTPYSSSSATTFTFTVPSNAIFLRFSYPNRDGDECQLERGTESTAYEPYEGIGLYTDGTPEVITLGEQTAHAENLFQVGDYADTQDIISGTVTRKVGVKVFDGTEDGWGDSGNNVFSTGRYMIPDRLASKVRLLCTHFRYSESTSSAIQNGYFGAANSTANIYFRNDSAANLEEWKAWLAAQYAAGTPVIVLYPLDEPTTESVTGQPMRTSAGDNTLSWTANVANKVMEVEYEKST